MEQKIDQIIALWVAFYDANDSEEKAGEDAWNALASADWESVFIGFAVAHDIRPEVAADIYAHRLIPMGKF